MFFRPAALVGSSLIALALLTGIASASPATTVGKVPVLAGPGGNYAALTTVPEGTHVDLIWCGTPDNWCLVEQHGRKGWVHLGDLNLKVHGPANAVDGGTSHSTADAGRTFDPNSHIKDQAAGLNPHDTGGGIQYVPVIGQ